MADKVLRQAEACYPIYQVNTEYHYRKVGVPTAFDELLMGLAYDFPQLKHKSLEDIIRIMRIDSVLVHHTLQNMVDSGVIESVELNEAWSALMVSDLKLTEFGRQLYREKKMPGRRRSEEAVFWFNPLSQQFGSKSNHRHDGGLVLNKALFPADEAVLQELSRNALPQQEWFGADVRLEPGGISTGCGDTARQSVPIQLTIDHNRYLHLNSSDELFEQWLQSRSAEVIKENLLEPLLRKARSLADEFETYLDTDEEGLLSWGLADDDILDKKAIGNAVAVKFADWQKFDKNSPLVIFNTEISEAKLDGKHLRVPADLDKVDGLTQLFYQFQSQTAFIEKVGGLICYFDHQPFDLPVKMLIKREQCQLAELLAFKKPNIATLIFMANFISYADVLDKLPEMDINQAEVFNQLIQKTWNKNFAPEAWAEKILPLNDENELSVFAKIFPKTTLHLKRFGSDMQSKLFDLALADEKSKVANVPELKELLMLGRELQHLNADKPILKTVNTDTLEKIRQWQQICTEFDRTFPDVLLSDGLKKLSDKVVQWKSKVSAWFEPEHEGRQYAVLDTNFIRHNPQKLTQIQQEYHVILPKVVLDELDSQKEKNKKALAVAENAFNGKSATLREVQQKVKDFSEQIETVNAELVSAEKELTAIQAQLTALRNKEQSHG